MANNHAEPSWADQEVITYRVLAKQPLSVELDSDDVLDLSIQGINCRLSVRPAHSDAATQRELGGALLAVEFNEDIQSDLLHVARDGYELIEDFLSALSVASGMTFEESEIVQVARLTADPEANCEFIQFNPLYLKHWYEPISDPIVRSVKNLLAHWDGMESGKRLRRAARRYRVALGTWDDVSAFQEAYIGLESMEPPLAKEVGLTPGTEEVPGKCDHCGHAFIRNRTTLVGVRAYVHGGKDLNAASEQRKSEWKLINKLRNDLMHGLQDQSALGERPHTALLASMHYLHDSICILSHAGNLASETYRLARGGTIFVTCGRFTAASWPALSAWGEMLGPSSFSWMKHPVHGLVPELNFQNSGMRDLELTFGRLTKSFTVATCEDIDPVNVERG